VFALLVFLIVVPIIELAVMVQVAGVIGVLPTAALVLVTSLVGLWLLQTEGLGVLRRMQTQINQGQLPGDEVVDGVLVLVGGLLMVLPGFITSLVGLLLLVPPVRSLLRPLVLARARRRVERGQAHVASFTSAGFAGAPFGSPSATFGGPVYDADAHLASTDPGVPRPTAPGPPSARPPSARPEFDS
jgi:UPF0716 protein FxsA